MTTMANLPIDPSERPGYKTTEFWKAVIVDITATVLVCVHKITPTEWAALTGGTTGIYALARSWVKK